MPEAPRFRELTSPEALGFREFVMVEAGSQLVQYPNRILAIGKKGNRSVRKISVQHHGEFCMPVTNALTFTSSRKVK
jgi:hypothetical protein